MSLTERLAKKYEARVWAGALTQDIEHERACWWLNEFTNMLDEEFPDIEDGKRRAWDVDDLIKWLRYRLKKEEADG